MSAVRQQTQFPALMRTGGQRDPPPPLPPHSSSTAHTIARATAKQSQMRKVGDQTLKESREERACSLFERHRGG